MKARQGITGNSSDEESIAEDVSEEEIKPEQEAKDKKDQFIGLHHGHYKLGCYVRIDLKLRKDHSR